MADSPVINTEIFFQLLVKYLRPDVICDVGALDASHSVLLRHITRIPRVIAFEANPDNYNAILEKGIDKTADIEVFHRAVSNEPGELVFHVQKYDDRSGQQWMAGTSSILERSRGVGDTEQVHVEAIRLDQFLQQLEPAIDEKQIALWIDVEGAAYQVLEGISGIANNILFIQVEVETVEVWQGQRLKQDVVELAQKMGFIELARGKHEEQHDLILINSIYLDNNRLKCALMTMLSVFFYYARKWGGHVFSNLLLVPILGFYRKH